MKWFLATLCAVVIVWSVAYPTTVYRFRITMNVDTPAGLKSASSVMEIKTYRYPGWVILSTGTGYSKVLKGEAVLLEFDAGGKSRNLVALLAHGERGNDVDFDLLPSQVFEPVWINNPAAGPPIDEVAKLPPGTKAELRGKRIPTLISFADLRDWKSASIVRPEDSRRAFGADVALRNMTIEIVSSGRWPLNQFGIGGESVTRQLESKIPEIVRQLRANATVMQVRDIRDPYSAGLGHLIRG